MADNDESLLLDDVDAESAGDEFAVGGRGWIRHLRVAALIGTIVFVECLVAYIYLPSAGKTAAVAAASETIEDELATELEEAPAIPIDQIEISLGKFSIMAFQPSTNTTLVIDFHLFGSVRTTDRSQFETLFQANENRFRDEVLVTIRSADLTELTDPGLGLIKRKFLTKTNKLLGKPLLQSVIFSEFSFIEQ